jgi:hypothetical protein
MTNEQRNNGDSNSNQDRVWPQAVSWDLGLGSAYRSDVLWRCDASRAGKLYQRSLFGSQAEAEEFARKMRDAEPDQMFSVDSIMASTVWN